MFSFENSLIYYFYDINSLLLNSIGRYKYSNHISNQPFFIGKTVDVCISGCERNIIILIGYNNII